MFFDFFFWYLIDLIFFINFALSDPREMRIAAIFCTCCHASSTFNWQTYTCTQCFVHFIFHRTNTKSSMRRDTDQIQFELFTKMISSEKQILHLKKCIVTSKFKFLKLQPTLRGPIIPYWTNENNIRIYVIFICYIILYIYNCI